MGRAVNFFEAQRQYNERGDFHLSEVVSGFVPAVLSALETRKGRSFWDSEPSFTAAYQANTIQQWRLLEDVTERIINEIRALRNGQDTPLIDRNPALDPYTLDLASMRSLEVRLQTVTGEQAGALLGEIRDILLQQGLGEDGQLDALLQIVALLSV